MLLKFIFAIFVLLLVQTSTYAQWTSTGPGGQSLSSISFSDADYGWTCGSAGSLFKTTDGGATWQQQINFQTPGVLNRLRAVALPFPRRVLTIWETPLNPQPTATYLSDDSGYVFEVEGYGTFNNFVFHHDVNRGLLVGDHGTARVAFSRGGPWHNSASGTQANLRDGDFPTSEVCYVVGDGGVIRRSNATLNGFVGQNSTTSQRLNGVYFSSATQGCVVGHGGTVLRTTDGGTTWTRIAVPTTVNLHDVWLLTANVGFAVGELGTILLTTDGGLNWRVEPSNTFETLYSLTATADGAHVWAAGDGGTVLKRGPVDVTATPTTSTTPTATRPSAFGQPWQAYPNPFTGSLTLDLPRLPAQRFDITIRDAAGRPVHHETLTSSANQRPRQLTLPATLVPGVYLLQLTADEQLTETRRLVKLP